MFNVLCCFCGAFNFHKETTRSKSCFWTSLHCEEKQRISIQFSSKEPVIFLDKLPSTKIPEVNFTFENPSTQTRIKKQKEPVSGERWASKTEEVKAASQQPAIQSQMRRRGSIKPKLLLRNLQLCIMEWRRTSRLNQKRSSAAETSQDLMKQLQDVTGHRRKVELHQLHLWESHVQARLMCWTTCRCLTKVLPGTAVYIIVHTLKIEIIFNTR